MSNISYNNDNENEEIEDEEINYKKSKGKKKSLKNALVCNTFIFIIITCAIILFSNIIIMKQKFDYINTEWVKSFVIQEANQLFTNFSNTLNKRIRILENVMIDSRVKNLQTAMELVLEGKFSNKIRQYHLF